MTWENLEEVFIFSENMFRSSNYSYNSCKVKLSPFYPSQNMRCYKLIASLRKLKPHMPVGRHYSSLPGTNVNLPILVDLLASSLFALSLVCKISHSGVCSHVLPLG